MFKQIASASIVALTALTIGSSPIHAQTSPTPDSIPSSQSNPDSTDMLPLFRGQNLARQAAEKANGGLGNYRAESSMYGLATQAPYVDNGNGTWTFTFKGTRPGETSPSYESAVTVSREGNVTIDYNGAVRSATP